MRILVCGGRDFDDYALLSLVLAGFKDRATAIIHGAARGADSLAGRWARENNVVEDTYPAAWHKYGKRAGPLRNQQMLDEGKPDTVIAFPGGRGTADMVRRSKAAGITPLEITVGYDLRD